MTARWAQYVGAPKNFENRESWLLTRLLSRNFFTGFCSDRSYECAYSTQSEVRSFTRSWDNRGTPKNLGLDMPMLPFSKNFLWAFVWMDLVNVPAKFEVRNSSFFVQYNTCLNSDFDRYYWVFPVLFVVKQLKLSTIQQNCLKGQNRNLPARSALVP